MLGGAPCWSKPVSSPLRQSTRPITWRQQDQRAIKLPPIVATSPVFVKCLTGLDAQYNGEVATIMLASWLRDYRIERTQFHSKTLFCDLKYKEISYMTDPLCRVHHPIRTAVSLDLFNIICNSIRPPRLRKIIHFVLNEMILALYQSNLSSLDPALDDLLAWRPYFDVYSEAISQYTAIVEQDNKVRISEAEMVEFERRKVFVINYQTIRYHRRVLTIIFVAWRDTTWSRVALKTKLDRYTELRQEARCLRYNKAVIACAWLSWRTLSISRTNRANKASSTSMAAICETMNVECDIATSSLELVRGSRVHIQQEVAQLQSSNKLSRLQIARQANFLSSMGARFNFQSKLIAELKRTFPGTLGVMVHEGLSALSRNEDCCGIVCGPDRPPIDIIERRLNEYCRTVAQRQSNVNFKSQEHKQQLCDTIQAPSDRLLAFALLDLTHVDDHVMRTFWANQMHHEAQVVIPMDDSLMTAILEVPVVNAIHTSLTFASSLNTELSSKAASTIADITRGLSSIGDALNKTFAFNTDIEGGEMQLLVESSNALLKTVKLPSEKASAHKIHAVQMDKETRFLQLLAPEYGLLVDAIHNGANTDPVAMEVFQIFRRYQQPLEEVFDCFAGLSAEGSSSRLNSGEFWKFLRECRVPSMTFGTTWEIAEMFIDVVRRNDEVVLNATTITHSTAPPRDRFERTKSSQGELFPPGARQGDEMLARLPSVAPLPVSGATSSGRQSKEKYSSDECLNNEIDIVQWEVVLLRIAARKFGSGLHADRPLPKCLSLLISSILSSTRTSERWCDFLLHVSNRPVRAVLHTHRAFLNSLFSFYSKQSGVRSGSLSRMDYVEFQQFWHQMKLMDFNITNAELSSIFAQVGAHVISLATSTLAENEELASKELLYPDFCQAIAALSCFYTPVRSPFIPLDEKLACFIMKYLKPMHRR